MIISEVQALLMKEKWKASVLSIYLDLKPSILLKLEAEEKTKQACSCFLDYGGDYADNDDLYMRNSLSPDGLVLHLVQQFKLFQCMIRSTWSSHSTLNSSLSKRSLLLPSLEEHLSIQGRTSICM